MKTNRKGRKSVVECAVVCAEELLRRRELARAERAFDLAEWCGGDKDRCGSGRWLLAMLRGDFEAAWRESDAIRRRGAPDPNRFWMGEDITGKRVILRCLHGLGDAVQFLRYAPMLRQGAAKLIVETPPALVELAPYFDGVDEVITWGESAPRAKPSWDVQMEILELPYVFRTQLRDLPIATEYLRLPRPVVESVAPRPTCADSLHVGLVWACGEWNPARSVPIELLRSVVDVDGCEFWNLQGGACRSDWELLGASDRLHDAYELSNTVLRLAALISHLDVVITPDTLAAHLAGALGVPAFVMLEHAADWRWMQRREDSPWYSSLRLFQQPKDGDWSGAVELVKRALEQHVHDRAAECVAA
jgi:hypothetical protein